MRWRRRQPVRPVPVATDASVGDGPQLRRLLGVVERFELRLPRQEARRRHHASVAEAAMRDGWWFAEDQ